MLPAMKRKQGRPRTTESAHRDTHVAIPVTAAQHAALHAIAEETGIGSYAALGRVFLASGLACWKATHRLPTVATTEEHHA
jgi:hypothetical protein